jgi:plastocyanin
MPLKLVGFAAGLMFLAACGSSTAPAGGGGGGGGGCTPTATKICMAGLSFSPSTLTVSAGTSVTWENGSNTTHTVTSATGSTLVYDSGNIGVGSVFSQTFNAPGTYHYYCKFHGLDGNPPSGMAGTITVQ